jgi:hypothetical protein
VTQATIFDSKKPISFFDDFQHFRRVLFVHGLLAQFLDLAQSTPLPCGSSDSILLLASVFSSDS